MCVHRNYLIVGLSKSLSDGKQSLNLKSPSALISESNKSPHSLPPAVTHIDANPITLPDTESSTISSSQPSVTSAIGGGASGELISKGFSLESSVDSPSLTTYMSSPLTSLTSTGSNVAMTLAGPIGNFSFNSQKLLSPAEFVSSPPHSLSSFSKVTPSDFSSALPSIASSTAVAAPATPTSIVVQTLIAPPPIKSAEDSSTDVTVESESSSNTYSDDDKVTPQESIQSAKRSSQDISATLDLPKPDVVLSKMSPQISSSVMSDLVIHPEDDANELLTSQRNQTSEAGRLSGQQQKSELLQMEARASQVSSDITDGNDHESENEEESAINVASNLVDTEPHFKSHSEVDSLPDMTGQSITDAQPTNNNIQFIQCNKCSTFNSSDVMICSHCGCAKNDHWTPQSFLKAVATKNSTDFMIAHSPSSVDMVAANESTGTVESSSAATAAADIDTSPISYTAALLTTAPDHGRVSSVEDVMTESSLNSIVTSHSSSSLQAAVAMPTTVTMDNKDTSVSIDNHIPSSSSVESISYSVNHPEFTR